METDTIEDPYLELKPLYGAGEDRCEAVPSHHMIADHRQAFHQFRMPTVTKSYEKANSKRGQTIRNFGRWKQETKSMLYVVTSVS
ncbi:hypothetical protein B9Z55_000714 [Caenorhabditis nigoni]|uniref:Uncharacterized protein n=1 Tax=Caenorhabditis nigoni TaxID=1611254 RepID=A0A2G5VUV3_9PELO|nr:hypothetical protein B9Z55_000714 [Caenorhabditis nigoni]